MIDNVSLDALARVKIPDLENSSQEERLFEINEASTHGEHKLVEGQEAALGTAKARIRKLEIENDQLAMLGPHRRLYSWWIFGFVIYFVTVTFLVLGLSSFQVVSSASAGEASFRTIITLDNDVLMTLLATNMVQAVGLLYVVAKWLFPTKSMKMSDL